MLFCFPGVKKSSRGNQKHSLIAVAFGLYLITSVATLIFPHFCINLDDLLSFFF